VTALPIAAVILDMDGVLIDTEPVWRSAESEIFAGLGLRLDEMDMASTMGMRVPEVVAHWRWARPWANAAVSDPTDAEIADRIIDRLVAHVVDMGEPRPGAIRVPALMRQLGLAVAIASSSPPRLIDAVCDRLGLGDITIRCSAAAEALGKPAPDVYLAAARRLGLEPALCLAVEDSPNGVLSAVAAGMRCIAVPDRLVAADPRLAVADLRLASLEDLDEDCLRSLGWRP
jgi:mannitol-1-/sugar-/sorbitol-6-/2-deoxyglucose-6-phosphatase